ncbi:terpene synthase family protein [Actinomadura kijaniata]|uniref:terpene synthase family protein n=1 Tax=Actinomadura kijaniata TaxID=46161 RepID=UPI003F1E0F7D
MPQDVRFHIPIAARRNPHYQQARERNLQWLRRHRMTHGTEATHAYLAWDLADLAARCWPDADVTDLALAIDLKAFYFLFDDQFDLPDGRDLAAITQVCQELINIAHQAAARPPSSPVTAAFADLWERSRQQMTPSWTARTACDWERYFAAHPHEEIRRRDQAVPTLDDYMIVRRGSAATESVTDMIERLTRVNLPPVVFHSPQVRLMRQIAADVPFLCNDVYSYEKEHARGDVYNLVTVLCHHRGVAVPDAVAQIQTMVDARIDQFMRLRDEVPRLSANLSLDSGQRDHLHRYVTGLGDWLRGHNDWMTRTARYRPSGTPPADQPGYQQELL